MPWIKQGPGRFTPTPTWQPFPPHSETVRLLPPGALVVHVGAGGRRIAPGTLTVDRSPFSGTRICSDSHQFALREDSVNCVVSTGTFEHVAEPARALREYRRVQRSGGLIHIETPFSFPYHPDPEDHARWALDGPRALFVREGFEEVRAGVYFVGRKPHD